MTGDPRTRIAELTELFHGAAALVEAFSRAGAAPRRRRKPAAKVAAKRTKRHKASPIKGRVVSDG